MSRSGSAQWRGVEQLISATLCAMDGSKSLCICIVAMVARMQVCIGEKYIQIAVAIIIDPPINSPILT
jgi:hypothetical protein